MKDEAAYNERPPDQIVADVDRLSRLIACAKLTTKAAKLTAIQQAAGRAGCGKSKIVDGVAKSIFAG